MNFINILRQLLRTFYFTLPPSPSYDIDIDQPAEMDSCQAYRKLALAKHPDRGGDPAEFARVSKAYEVLGVSIVMGVPRNEWFILENPFING